MPRIGLLELLSQVAKGDAKVRDQPLIWVVDGLCEQQHVQQLKEILDQQDVSFVRKTAA